MSRMGAEYTLAAAVVALVVWMAAAGITGPMGESAVRLGAGAGFAVQVVIFWALFVWSLQGRWGIAHGIGAIVRFAAVAVMALAVVPSTGYPAAPVLFSFVACLFGCTLLEPIFLKRQQSAERSSGAAMIRTES